MAWKDIFRGFLNYFPLFIAKGEMPIACTPTGTLAASGNSAWPIVLAAGASVPVQLLIPNDCVLEVNDWVASTSYASFPNQYGFNVNIWWGNRQKLLTQSAMPGEMIFGTAQRPSYWGQRPWRIASPQGPQGTQNIQFEVTSTSTVTNTIYFALRGWRTSTVVEG